VVGNLKIDVPPPPVDHEALQALETALDGRPRFVAASTHEGEEMIIGEAHRLLVERDDRFCTIIAPRHPERGVGVCEQLRKLGLKVRLRSAGQLPDAGTDVYIADTIGELGTFYRLADIAFIGGTLVDHGGQNPVEAIRHDTAVLAGPSRHNFVPIYRRLDETTAVRTVNGAKDIANHVTALLTDPDSLDQLKQRGAAAVDTLSGALPTTIACLLQSLDDCGRNQPGRGEPPAPAQSLDLARAD
jgi:3-deoxy-D-manno-octulosonic-acid transferase